MEGRYDVIIVGGGHNGLCAAIDLAETGRSVLVLEARGQVGGCASTSEPLLAGFRHSPHANCLIFSDVMPLRFAPAPLQVETHFPEAQLGLAFADGRPPVILHRPDLLARTKASLAVYSRRDAAAYVDLKRRSARLGPTIGRSLYAAPQPQFFADQAEAVRVAFAGCCDLRTLGQGNARTLIDACFETPEVRMLFYHLAMETGLSLHERGSDLGFLAYSLWIAGRWRVPAGGMGAYSNALGRAAISAGAAIACGTAAARVVVEGARAIGVETAGGAIVRAAQAVIAATPILDTFDRLLPKVAIPAREREELAVFRQQRPGSIATSVFCLDRPPRYRSARHDAAIDRCLKTVIGHETPADVIAHDRDLRTGLLPAPAGVVRLHSLWDPSLAPAGRHVAGIDSSFPPHAVMDEESWTMVEAAFPDALFDTWSRSCEPGFGPPLAGACDLSAPFERRMLLRMGAAQYRSGVPGLYLAGPGLYPGGGVHGASGHNAAQVVMADHPGAE